VGTPANITGLLQPVGRSYFLVYCGWCCSNLSFRVFGCQCTTYYHLWSMCVWKSAIWGVEFCAVSSFPAVPKIGIVFHSMQNAPLFSFSRCSLTILIFMCSLELWYMQGRRSSELASLEKWECQIRGRILQVLGGSSSSHQSISSVVSVSYTLRSLDVGAFQSCRTMRVFANLGKYPRVLQIYVMWQRYAFR